MSLNRGEFTSRIGFIMAATGSAVGLGNVWGFPTQTANNGGGAFVLVYLILAFLLAYPALMAELILGRHSRSNIVSALGGLSKKPLVKLLGQSVGYYGVLIASLLLSFYTIVAGWMIAFALDAFAQAFEMEALGQWLTNQSLTRNLIFTGLFSIFTLVIIAGGVEKGIERWTTRLMPTLLVLLAILIVYVLMQEGAVEGLKVYLNPDFSRIGDSGLVIDALGQAFFSLSLGVGTMLIYGSYLSKNENLPKMGALVTLVDVGIAFTAGLLIIPAIYVAQAQGLNIFNDNGSLIAGPDLIFQVLPSLFSSMGNIGLIVSAVFFILLSIAALTSSISMLEVPVSLAVEKTSLSRPKASILLGTAIFIVSTIIIFNFSALFGFIIDLTTKYSEPLLGVALCLFAGWAISRDTLLKELSQGQPEIANTLFWKIWPLYVKVVCPALILLTFYDSVF